jgi:hypothetical protein
MHIDTDGSIEGLSGLVIASTFARFTQMCEQYPAKLVTLFENNRILLIKDNDRHQEWAALIDDHPWLKDQRSIYRLTDTPDDDVSNSLFLHNRYMTDLLDIDGMHLLTGENQIDGFFCLMNRRRPHRDLLLQSFNDKNLISDNLIVYHDNPFKHISMESFDQFDDLQDFNSNGSWQDGNINKFYNSHSLEIVAEYSYTKRYFSEKTAKPLLAGMPFMTVAAKGQLDYLRSMGFITYSDYLDESYDSEDSLEKRIEIITKNLFDLANKPGSFLKLYSNTRLIAKHNQNMMLARLGQEKYHMADKLRNFIERMT